MANYTIESSFVVQVGEVSATSITVSSLAGQDGTDGTDGTDGNGVVIGGTTGQVLAKIDATDYNTEWVDSSGGGETQIYQKIYNLDSSNVLNWMSGAATVNNTEMHHYSTNTGIALSSSILGYTSANESQRPFGMAKYAQTIDSLTFFAGISKPNNFVKAALVKTRYINSDLATVDYRTILWSGDVTISTAGYFNVAAGSFTVTSLADGDIIFLYLGSDTLSDVFPIIVTLKSNID